VDATALLAILVAVMAVNTVAIVALLVLTVRDRRPLVDGRPLRPTIARPVLEPAATGLPAPPGVPGGAGQPPRSETQADPLAGAISAFLGRSDGLFRAGAPAPGPAHQPTAVPPQVPAPFGPDPATPPVGPAATGAFDRPRSEVTWAPSRPTRYVPSGPRPGAPIDPDRPAATPSVRQPAAPPRRPASRLEVRLVGREPTPPTAATGATARLGPVIGGLLRERTRARDSITTEGSGHYAVVLPETSVDGAAAVASRLLGSCDAWLAAETPPLRLDLDVADLPGGVPAADPDPARGSGPERRRPLVLDV
jgi:hypothetical protein